MCHAGAEREPIRAPSPGPGRFRVPIGRGGQPEVVALGSSEPALVAAPAALLLVTVFSLQLA